MQSGQTAVIIRYRIFQLGLIILRLIRIFTACLALFLLIGCASHTPAADVAATTAPVAQFAQSIASGTPITITQIISESVSCLHDYSLSVSQMKILEQSQLILISGLGLEDFMEDILDGRNVTDCSAGAEFLTLEGHDDHDGHDHGHFDPHIWLSPEQAQIMAENICHALTAQFPEHGATFRSNTDTLKNQLTQLQTEGQAALSDLSCRKLITFHDGFAYLANAFDLEILAAIEEENGSEASAKELIQIIRLVQEHNLPAVFTEVNGSVSAASIICAETGIPDYPLDMAMNGDYFEAMEANIQTLKEALQ